MKNDLLKDIWEIRDQLGAECGFDLKRLGTLIHREETKVGKRLVHPSKPAARHKRSTVAA
ncbi:MAG: hypothetical protein RLZZ350_319 [Verrucomicrobiota bacterium]|jgi:hypothetical protein